MSDRRPHEPFVWLWFWLLVVLIAVVFAMWAIYGAAEAQSLREIVQQSEGAVAPPPPSAPALPWATFEEIHADFVGDMQHPVCGDIADSYLSPVIRDGVGWIWFWGNARFALSQLGPDHALVRVYEGRVDAGRLVVAHTMTPDQLTKQSTPCTWLRATES